MGNIYEITSSNRDTWDYLFKKQKLNTQELASAKWLAGFSKMEDKLDSIPILSDLRACNWEAFPVIGVFPQHLFWKAISVYKFPVNLRLRTYEQRDYLEERCMWHDSFGHMPMLWDKDFSNYLHSLAMFEATHFKDPEAMKALANVYWFTAEFGLVFERDGLKAYGAGIISSPAEIKHAVEKAGVDRRLMESRDKSFDENMLDIITTKEYITDGFQDRYYALNSWGMLPDIVRWLHKHFG